MRSRKYVDVKMGKKEVMEEEDQFGEMGGYFGLLDESTEFSLMEV